MRRILDFRPQHFSEFREPFCGNAPSISCTDVLPRHMPRWLSDLDGDLMNFYHALCDDVDAFIEKWCALRERCFTVQRTLDIFEEQKHRFLEGDPVAFLFLHRVAYNGIVSRRRRNIASYSLKRIREVHTLKIAKLRHKSELLQGVRLTNLDYREVLAEPPRGPGPTLIFNDPPYLVVNQESPFYQHNFDEADLSAFKEMVLGLDPDQFKVLITLGETEFTHEHFALDDRFRVRYRHYTSNTSYSKERKAAEGESSGGCRRTRELILTTY